VFEQLSAIWQSTFDIQLLMNL